MASQPLRVGIVGAGRVARVHAKALEHVDGAEVVAISDPALERAEALAGELGAAAHADHRDLLEGCDAVWICSPPTTHLQQVTDAAEAGCHVMLEKPIATTVEDCLGMIEAVERAGVKTIVDFNNRFRWPFRFMRDAIAAGEIGELLSIWSHRIGPSPSTLGTTWRQDPRLLSGFTIE
ncbi:MAG: Gfo/Idh/MocA family protein [Conexibacter sp.]